MDSTEVQRSQDGPESVTLRRAMTDVGNKEQRLLRVDQIYSRKDRQVHFVKTAKSSVKSSRFRKTALVVRRVISKQGMVARVEVDIKSECLRDAFLDIFHGVEGLELNKDPPMADPELIYHARDELLARKAAEKESAEPNQTLINDIGTALRFVDEDFGDRIAMIENLISHGEITYDLLSMFFHPKEILYAPKHGLLNQKLAARLTGSEYKIRQNGSKYFEVKGKIINHDGDIFGYGQMSFEIDEYVGARRITNLDVYPLKFDPNLDSVRRELVARGRRYLSYVDSPKCLDYSHDYALKLHDHASNSRDHASNFLDLLSMLRPKEIQRFRGSGRVVLDSVAFSNYNGNAFELMEPRVSEEDEITTRDFSDEQLLICAYWLNGFSLSQKQWGSFAVSSCTDIEWNELAFQKLVIPKKHRDMVYALVKAHRQDDTTFDDLIQNKGKGLIGLLTGSPGVGKTLTAEAVAEVTHRPLYVVSAGEIGTDTDLVDARVQEILEITRRWSCVLLIDEADVFMAARGTDLARNTLVSIFLRRLEYYCGVLILTTNRKSEIDVAFQSRIHFTLHYKDLDESARATVWRNFFESASASKSGNHFNISDRDITTLAKLQLNGRQIKNAVSIAASLAREDRRAKTVADITEMIDILLK